MVDSAGRLIPQPVSLPGQPATPVHFFVIEEKYFGHVADFFQNFFFEHEGCPVQEGRRTRNIVLPFVRFVISGGMIAQGVAGHWGESGILDGVRWKCKAYFRTYGSYIGIVFECITESGQTIVFNIGVVVEQKNIFSLSLCYPQVVTSGETQILLTPENDGMRITLPEHGCLIFPGTVVYDNDFVGTGMQVLLYGIE